MAKPMGRMRYFTEMGFSYQADSIYHALSRVKSTFEVGNYVVIAIHEDVAFVSYRANSELAYELRDRVLSQTIYPVIKVFIFGGK